MNLSAELDIANNITISQATRAQLSCLLLIDEFHFLMICPAYDNLRAVLLSAANVMLLDPKIQFSTIMRSENTIVIRRLAQFTMDANKLRDSLETAI